MSVNGPMYQYVPPPVPYHEYQRVGAERDFLYHQVQELRSLRSGEPGNEVRESVRVVRRYMDSQFMGIRGTDAPAMRRLLRWVRGQLRDIGGSVD